MSGMDSIGEAFIRRIVREELAAYETLLNEWLTQDSIAGIAHRNVKYQDFIDRLLDDPTKKQTD